MAVISVGAAMMIWVGIRVYDNDNDDDDGNGRTATHTCKPLRFQPRGSKAKSWPNKFSGKKTKLLPATFLLNLI